MTHARRVALATPNARRLIRARLIQPAIASIERRRRQLSQLPARFWTPLEIADNLRFDRRTVQKWIREGDLPANKIQGQWRVSDDDYKEFIRRKFGAQ